MVLFWKRKAYIAGQTWTFGESDDQVRDKSESKYQRVQDKSETIEKRLESETGLEYYSSSLYYQKNVHTTKTLILTSSVDEAGSRMICENIGAFRRI